MNLLSVARNLVQEMSSGNYVPTRLGGCETTLTRDRYPQLVRFVEFTLFMERPGTHLSLPRYLVLQPQSVLARRNATAQARNYRKNTIDPFLDYWQSELPTNRVPDPQTAQVSEIRQALRDLARESATNDISPLSRARYAMPSFDLPERQLRARAQAWVAGRTDAEARRILRAISLTVGGQIGSPVGANMLTVNDLGDALMQVPFPGPYQPLVGTLWPVALCARYEQTWELEGYTRGDIVSSLSLAPGERVTLEVHTWDKSSRRSEDELAVDFEMRTAEKATQRDALTVAQEHAAQTTTSVKVNGTIPIPKMPIGVSVGTNMQVRDNLRQTTDQLREQTLEASTTLKLNRKTRIEISRETGREEKQTRTLENTNRCHTLNCHYFEVMANYTVTTQLATIVPCVLLRYPQPVITMDWILCHQDILIRSLLDQTFLAGFEGARQAKIAATMAEIEARDRLAQLETLGEQVAPFAAAIARAYGVLTDARDAADAVFNRFGGGPGIEYAIAVALGVLGLQRLYRYFGLEASAQIALAALVQDLAANRNPASALRALLTLVPRDLPARPIRRVNNILNTRYETYAGELGDNELRSIFGATDDILTYDDAGLRAGIAAAFDFLRSVPAAGVTPVEDGLAADPALAASQVEFERLQCHIEEHWLHYAQEVWMKEDHDQRLLRLQSYGPITSILENELLGFYTDRGAFPLRDPTAVSEVDLVALSQQIQTDIDQSKPEPVMISMPTPGVIMEAVTGECNACEDYISESRTIDLRTQAARASQEEAEADRRQQRVGQGDLSDPAPSPNALIVELRQDNAPSGDGT